jgi:hypothetical protein
LSQRNTAAVTVIMTAVSIVLYIIFLSLIPVHPMISNLNSLV